MNEAKPKRARELDRVSKEILAAFVVGLVWSIGSFFVPLSPSDQMFMRIVGTCMIVLGVIESFIEKKV